MDATTLAALVVFAGLGAALWLLAVAILRPPARAAIRFRLRFPARARTAVGAAVLVAVLTRWPVAALAAGALVWFRPWRLRGASVARARLERLDALAAWTESLKDTIAGAVGLEEAIPATVPGAAPTIRPGLERLVERLRARQPLSAALRGLAEDLDDPSADLVIAALVLNAGLRGPGLATALEALAVCAREELALRQKVESGRRALRTGVRIIAGTTLGFVVALTLLDSTYLRPYDSLTGQLVLALVAGIFAAAFAWLSRLGRDTAPLRLLSATGSGGPR